MAFALRSLTPTAKDNPSEKHSAPGPAPHRRQRDRRSASRKRTHLFTSSAPARVRAESRRPGPDGGLSIGEQVVEGESWAAREPLVEKG